MTRFYNSTFYPKPIRVENIDWEILVIITDKFWREAIYSRYNIAENNTESVYINKCLLWGFIKKIPESVLIIGFWGWAFAKFLEHHIENIAITWVDIDATMIEIAKKELHIKTNDFYIMDAHEAIKRIIKEDRKYDLVLIDVYGWEWETPHYFEESLFFEDIKKVLTEDSVVSINFANYDERYKKYNTIHSHLTSTFWKYYSHLLLWEDDRWNVAWIYNLDTFYTAEAYNDNYLKNYRAWKIAYNWKIMNNTFIDTQMI